MFELPLRNPGGTLGPLVQPNANYKAAHPVFRRVLLATLYARGLNHLETGNPTRATGIMDPGLL